MFQGITSVVLIAVLIYFAADDYATVNRLENTVNNLIEDVNMPESDKFENLSWLCRNCIMFSERSILFKRRYQNIAARIQEIL